MSSSAWVPRRGDINGLFGLLIDNFAALVLLYMLLGSLGFQVDRFAPSFLLTWVIPGTVAGVLIGGVLYALLAGRLAWRSGRQDVTAMPVGLDTPSVFAMSLFVLLPALAEGRELFAPRGLEERELQHLASVFAWHVGAVVLVVLGLFKTVLAPLGLQIRRWAPRAALLGSLAAVALALIAFLPVARHIAPAPVVGLPVLAVILVTLLARRGTQDIVPGAVLALGVGLVIVLISIFLGEWRGWYFVPLPERSLLRAGPLPPLPAESWTADWWTQVWWSALYKLPVALPFALFTLVGGVQCAESSAAAGDEYDARGVLLVQGVASTVAGLLGGVVQTTPYFGHPAYKNMGAGWTYVVLSTLVLALAGYFGWFAHVFEFVPGAVLFPVIVYIGLRTIAHSFAVTPARDYAALALAAVPVLAYLMVILADEIFAGRTPNPAGVVLLHALRCLGNGFILTSLFWAVATTAILDGRAGRGVVALLLAAVCSLVGLIHSPLPGAPLAWPHEVWQQLASSPHTALRYQSPFHWAAAYVLAAVVLRIASWLPAQNAAGEEPASAASSTPAAVLHAVTEKDPSRGEVSVP
jgi:AGZA family xanthine/uracil permease-like MFS transporter